MKRLDFRTVVVVLLAAAAGCKGDPTADLRGGASQLGLNPDLMFIDSADTKPFAVTIRDQQLNPVAGRVEVTSSAPSIMTVEQDTAAGSADSANYNFLVNGISPGAAKLIVTSGGLADTATVSVLPVVFLGALSSTTLEGGDTLTIASTSLLKFDTATVAVTFEGGGPGVVVSKTPDTIKVLVPFGTAGPATIDGIDVTYVPGLVITRATEQAITQTGDLWAGDTAYTTAPTLPLPTVTGQAFQYLTMLPTIDNDAHCGEGTGGGATGKCTIFKYVANGTDSLRFSVNWTPPTDAASGDADIDIYSCTSAGVAGCFEGGAAGAAGATGKTPEVFTIKPSAGTHYLVIEQFTSGEDPNVFITITKKN
jgi:hypothetical protein